LLDHTLFLFFHAIKWYKIKNKLVNKNLTNLSKLTVARYSYIGCIDIWETVPVAPFITATNLASIKINKMINSE